MSKHRYTIAHYTFPYDQVNALLSSGLEVADNVEALAQKLLNDQLKDKKYEIIRGLQFDQEKKCMDI
jgi:hypothetical protein